MISHTHTHTHTYIHSACMLQVGEFLLRHMSGSKAGVSHACAQSLLALAGMAEGGLCAPSPTWAAQAMSVIVDLWAPEGHGPARPALLTLLASNVHLLQVRWGL